MTKNPTTWIALILTLSVPFSYASIEGVRVIILFLLAAFVLLAMDGIKYRNYGCIGAFGVLILYAAMMSALEMSFSVVSAIITFGALCYWPVFIGKRAVLKINLDKFINLYVYAGIGMAIALVVQIILFNSYGIQFGRIDLMPGRTGFSLLWDDYSFLSIYFASLMPLVLRAKFSKIIKMTFIAMSLVASILTTARSGVVAFFLVCLIILFYRSLQVVFRLKVSRQNLALGLCCMVVSFALAYFSGDLTQETRGSADVLDNNGRMRTYLNALAFLRDNPLFGANFNISRYEMRSMLPHNVFLDILTSGGMVFFLFVMIWLIPLLVFYIKNSDAYLKYSILISLIGLQFVPSFFSAYFFAYILALSMISAKQSTSKLKMATV